MKKLISLLLVSLITVSTAFAETTKPEGLKAQLDTMKAQVPERFDCMINAITESWSDDQSMFLYVLKNNIKAYWDIREEDYSQDIVLAALERFPCDFPMVLYIIKKETAAKAELDSLLN